MLRSKFQTGLIILLWFFACTSVYAIPEKDTGNLGEIRQSILSEKDFQKIYGDGWVPLDGRDIEDSDLYKEGLWKSRKLPDVRGRFLRSHNSGRATQEGNPLGDLGVGSGQMDVFQSHDHGGGDHRHDFACEYTASRCAGKLGNTMAWCPSQNTIHETSTCGTILRTEGGPETRPRCVVVNTFIKIGRTPENQQLNSILESIAQIPELLFKSKAFVRLVRKYAPAPNPAEMKK